MSSSVCYASFLCSVENSCLGSGWFALKSRAFAFSSPSLSVWRKMQLQDPLTLGRVARSLPADYSYFHKLFLCVSALGSGSMSFWSLRHNSYFAGPGSVLLLDVSTVIYQDQTTVGVPCNFSTILKEPLHESFRNPLLTLYRPTQATEEQSARLKRQLLIRERH